MQYLRCDDKKYHSTQFSIKLSDRSLLEGQYETKILVLIKLVFILRQQQENWPGIRLISDAEAK